MAAPRWTEANVGRWKRSRKAEAHTAAQLGGKSLPRSGGMVVARGPDAPTMEGDLRTPTLHIEHKRTDTPVMVVERKWFEGVCRGAVRANRTASVVLLFERLGERNLEWLFLPLAFFQNITGCAKDTARFRGGIRETAHASLRLRTEEVLALENAAPEGTIPTLGIVWTRLRPAGPATTEVWIGAPLPALRPFLERTDVP